MHTLTLRGDHITLAQAVKAAGLAATGGQAKYVVRSGSVRVNGEVELRPGRKLVEGDRFESVQQGEWWIVRNPGVVVSLPHAESAIITEDKVAGYLLNAAHPEGSPKAEFFRLMGFRTDQWQALATALRRLAQTCAVSRSVESAHGRKYIVEGPVDTPSGRRASLRTVWIVDHGGELPRLVTAYPFEEGT